MPKVVKFWEGSSPKSVINILEEMITRRHRKEKKRIWFTFPKTGFVGEGREAGGGEAPPRPRPVPAPSPLRPLLHPPRGMRKGGALRAARGGAVQRAGEGTTTTRSSIPELRDQAFAMTTLLAAVVGGAVALGTAPLVLTGMGFTATGIAASSLAAKMMSAAAIANGGGVAAGGVVATLQSIGAAGLSASSNMILGSIGATVGALLGNSTGS
ncbi:PREDICTED: uncharacterized protein LOC102012027 [Chinchilla lanigera]|nr:PREDICTED: uncharacterized protein LOC102012027 [Chinchilla lanigera]